jgi:hypothetical protein
MATGDTTPTTTPQDLTTMTPAELVALANSLNTSSSGLIGLAKGQTAVGEFKDPAVGPGLEAAPGNVAPNERGMQFTQFDTVPNANAYKEGDQITPGTGSQAQIAEMQGQLIRAGLLLPQDVRAGFWDDKSQSAYKVVLGFANQYGMNAQDALQQFVNNPVPAASSYRYPIALTNPQTMAADFANTAQSMTGGGLPASESQAFQTYQTGQEEAARQRYISGKTDQQSAYVGAPSSTAADRYYILAHNQQDIVNYDMALRTMQFSAALKEL